MEIAEPAAAELPNVLMADCTKMLATQNTALCIAAGMPMRRMLLRYFHSIRHFRRDRRNSSGSRHSQNTTKNALTAVEISVASATPITLSLHTTTKNRFSNTFIMPDKIRAASGLCCPLWSAVSPSRNYKQRERVRPGSILLSSWLPMS